MSYRGDKLAGDTIYFKFTSINASGVPTAITTPVLAIYKNNSTTESQAGLTLTAGFDGFTGLHQVTIDTSQDGTFYANGSDFQVVVVTGSVSGNSIVGYVVGEFSLANRSALRPTTAGRTLDVSAEGEAGLDWANIGSPTTAQNLSGTNIDTDQVVASVTNRVTANVDQLNGVAQSLLDLKDFADDGYDPSTNKVQGVVLTDTVTTYTGNTPQTGDSFARLGAPAGASVSADIAAIEAQTDDIGAAGAGLSAIPWNSAWDAEIESEVTDALNSYDPPTRAELTSDTNSILSVLSTIAGYIDTEVAAIKAKTDQLTFTTANKVDATIQVAGDFAQAAADKVWSTASRTLTAFGFSVTVGTNNDKTGYTLSAAGVQAIWDALTSALTTAGSIGKLLVDNVNATISSRSSHSAADVWAVATRVLTAGTNIVLAKGTGVTGFNDLSAAEVNAEVVDALNVDTYAEPGQGAPAATTTLAAKINYLYKAFRNPKTQTATTLSLYNDAGTVVDQKATISDDGTTYTHGKIGTGP